MRTIFLLAGLLLLGACASNGTGAGVLNSYAAEYDALRSRCDARGGALEPLGRGGTGRPATDYTCTIRSGPSDNIRR